MRLYVCSGLRRRLIGCFDAGRLGFDLRWFAIALALVAGCLPVSACFPLSETAEEPVVVDPPPPVESGPGVGKLPGPVLLPGMRVVRRVGPVVFTISLNGTLARVVASVTMDGANMADLVMTTQKPTATFKIADGRQTASGSLGTFFCAPPAHSYILVDFTVSPSDSQRPTDFTAYRGDIVAWQSPTSLVIDRQQSFLMPDLLAQVELKDSYQDDSPNRLSAEVSFWYATQLIDLYALASTVSPVTLRPSKVGAVSIESGQLSFTPATAEQSGKVYIDIKANSTTNGSLDYSGSLATWPWIEGRADQCRGEP